jgi:hypothetical protein
MHGAGKKVAPTCLLLRHREHCLFFPLAGRCTLDRFYLRWTKANFITSYLFFLLFHNQCGAGVYRQASRAILRVDARSGSFDSLVEVEIGSNVSSSFLMCALSRFCAFVLCPNKWLGGAYYLT